MSAPDQSREPCPDRILDDMGGAFGMGAVGGSVFHFIKGLKNSPNGERLAGGVQAVRMNAPRVGGSFAVWGGLFSVFDCSMVYIRKKEDPWNPIFAGAATGGFLQMRHGLKSASRSAMFGGVLLALIEGAGLMINRVLASMPQQLPPPQVEQPMGLPSGAMYGGDAAGVLGAPSAGANASMKSETPSESESGWRSWTGGFFGGKKEETSSSTLYDGLSSFPSTSSGSEGLSSVLSSSSNESSSPEKKGWKSWTGGYFGGKKEESASPASESLGSFETSSGPAMPTFDYK